MVNGFISQFVVQVMANPRGRLTECAILPKSTFTIMGYIMIQIRIATGMDTFAYSHFEIVSGNADHSLPTATPVMMQIATHRLRYFSKKLRPPSGFFSSGSLLLFHIIM